MSEMYFSTDIEADGPIPGPHSMLSIASAAYLAEGTLIATFSANLETLPEATPHPETMEWWRTKPLAWELCRSNLESPADGMHRFVRWVRSHDGRPIFVGYPASYDFLFVYWYLMRFVGESPFGHSALDIKSYAMAVLRSDFRGTTKKTMPKSWFSNHPHTHIALDDAIEQGALFCRMLAANRTSKS